MADFNTIGQQYVQHYYNTFDTNREVSKSLPHLMFIFIGFERVLQC